MKENPFGYWHMIYDSISNEDHLPSYIEIRKSEYKLLTTHENKYNLYQWYDTNRKEYSNGFFLSKEAAATDIYNWLQGNP